MAFRIVNSLQCGVPVIRKSAGDVSITGFDPFLSWSIRVRPNLRLSLLIITQLMSSKTRSALASALVLSFWGAVPIGLVKESSLTIVVVRPPLPYAKAATKSLW